MPQPEWRTRITLVRYERVGRYMGVTKGGGLSKASSLEVTVTGRDTMRKLRLGANVRRTKQIVSDFEEWTRTRVDAGFGLG